MIQVIVPTAFRSPLAACVALLLGVVASPASAQDVLLAWKWRQGAERRYEVTSTFNQTIQYDRSPRPQANDPSRPPPRPNRPPAVDPDETRRIHCTQILNVVERVVSVDEQGIATVTQTYQRVRIDGTDSGPDGTEHFDYDSALRSGRSVDNPPTPARPPQSPRQRLQNPSSEPQPTPAGNPHSRENPDHPLILPFAAMAGRTITFRITAEGRVLSCQGGDEVLEAVFSPMEGDSPFNPLALLFKAAVTNESLAQQCQQGLSLIPNRVVRRGQSWPMGLRQVLPLVGALRSDITCRLTSVRGRQGSQVASIENQGQLILEGGDAGVQNVAGLFEVHLGSSEMTGTTDFDVEGGFVRSQKQRMVSEWEVYAPDWEDLDRLGEPVKITQRLEQDMSMRLER